MLGNEFIANALAQLETRHGIIQVRVNDGQVEG